MMKPLSGHKTPLLFTDSDDCKQCPRVLAEVEHIDDDADKAGIDFVKIDDKQMAKEFGVFALPAIVFFKPSSKEPVIYAGTLFTLLRSEICSSSGFHLCQF